MAFDQARNQLVVFGGIDAAGVEVPAQTWLWTNSWTQASPSASPPARFGPAMAYDAKRKVVVVFGGGIDGGGGAPDLFNDTWEWNGTTWTPITTATKPPARAVGTMSFDAARGVMLLANGIVLDALMLPELVNDLWQYDGTNWTQLAAPTPLNERVFSPLAYDTTARQSDMFGGQSFGGGIFGDTWSWTGTEFVERYPATRPSDRGGHVANSSPDGAGIIVYGGRFGDGSVDLTSDLWSLRYENEQPREQCTVVTDNDGDGFPGCMDPDCWSPCTPLCSPGMQCDPAAARCGDGVCNAALENCRICAQDCTCTAACGDGFCDAPETQATCAGDCTP